MSGGRNAVRRCGGLRLLLVLPLTGCIAKGQPRASNIVLVVADTLRADRLSLYGYSRPTSPEIDRFARERGVVFRHAWSNAGCTNPSVKSLLTGRWPQLFTRNRTPTTPEIPPEIPTLAQLLAEAGFGTAAVSASGVVRAAPGSYNRRGGYGAGFARFDESCELEAAACVNRVAFEELGRLEEPFFLYLHYLDPHHPYRPPAGSSRGFSEASASAAAVWARTGDIWPAEQKLYEGVEGVRFGDAEVRHLSDLYDDEIRYFDGEFGRLARELDRRGLDERTVLVLVSDHGEELFDHGHLGHCKDLAFESVLAIPFVLWVPGIAPGERLTLVSNLDLLPTLLDLAALHGRRVALDGTSLVPLLRRGDLGAMAERTLFAAQGRTRAARTRHLRVHLDLASLLPSFESLRLQASEGEFSAEAERARLLEALHAWLEREDPDSGTDSLKDAAALESELRALGYL